jgi:hypothetical protein
MLAQAMARHRLREPPERRCQGGNAAAVRAVGEVVGVGAAEVRHHLAQAALHRVVVLDVALRRIAIGDGSRQEATVLARAVVEGGRRHGALAYQCLDARLQARRMGAALEVVLAEPDLGEPAAHRLDMPPLAVV